MSDPGSRHRPPSGNGPKEPETEDPQRLVADWAREANSASEPQSVLAIERAELDEALRDKHGGDRLTVLRVQMLQRAINRLSVRSFALGTAIVDKRMTPDAARPQGQALIAETDALLPRLHAIGDADAAKRLRRDLDEVRWRRSSPSRARP